MRTCTSVIFIQSTPEAVWRALTDPAESTRYWAHRNVSDWRPGSAWAHRRADGSEIADIAGTVLESASPTRLVLTWANPVDGTPVAGLAQERGRGGPSRVTVDIAGYRELSRLTITHDDLADDAERDALAAGWAAVLSNLKTYLETGHPLAQPPWEMLPGFVRA